MILNCLYEKAGYRVASFPKRGKVMKMKIFLSIVTVVAVFGMCLGVGNAATDPANATYFGVFEDIKAITLKDGHWEGKPFVPGGARRPTAGLLEGFHVAGDLTGDGKPEEAVILWQNSGGSGTYYFLAVLEKKGKELVNIATTPLGDRVQILGGNIRKKRLELKVLRHGPDDPRCCPSQKVLRVWSLKGNKLVPGKTMVLGKFTVKDLGGVVWVLNRIHYKGKPLPPKPRITLVIDGENVHGTAGCNRYRGKARIPEDIVGEIKIVDLMSTKKMCPEKVMALEKRYLEALKGVTGFSFVGNRLVLAYSTGKRGDALDSPDAGDGVGDGKKGHGHDPHPNPREG